MRVTLLLLGDRSASGLEMRKSSHKSLGRRKAPSLVVENEVDFEGDEALGNNDA
jgi:hypothetical protein